MLYYCAGNYAKELEEDYTVYDAISEVQGILGANEIKCNALRAQYSKYGYLWKRDLNETLKVLFALVHSCTHLAQLQSDRPQDLSCFDEQTTQGIHI